MALLGRKSLGIALGSRSMQVAELERIGRACLKSFGVKERFFHIEFFLTASGEYVALEVNMRPPGGYTTDMFNYGADIDVYRAWAQLLVQGWL